MSRRRAQRWDEAEDPIDWRRITPRTGSLATHGQRSFQIAPPPPPRAFIIACDHCVWESPEVSTVAESKRLLVAHGRASHSPTIAQSIDVRARSGKYQFRIEVIEK